MPTPDAATAAEALVLIQAQAQVRQDLVDITQAQVAAQVRSFSAWYDPAKITAWSGLMAKLVRASQRQTAASTDVYALRILALLTGRRPTTGGPVKVDDLWGGVPLETVFERLPAQVRWLEATRSRDAPPEVRLSPGSGLPLSSLTHDQIIERAVARAEIQAETALSLAFREQWVSDLAESPATVGYRRVLHPELAKGGSCGLCIAAATNVYSKRDLLPLHGRCSCSVAPVVGELLGPGDPGAELNRVDLQSIYAAAGDSTRGLDLKRARFKVQEHGELGPVLVSSRDGFKGPAAAAKARASTRRSRASVDPAVVLAAAERTIADLERRTAAGEDVSGPLRFQRTLASRMRARIHAG